MSTKLFLFYYFIYFEVINHLLFLVTELCLVRHFGRWIFENITLVIVLKHLVSL